MIIRAKEATGKYESDIVLNNTDIQKILGADKKSGFLRKFKVLIVING